MKVLYIGNFLDPTGWGRGSCDYVLAMDAAGVDLVVRPIKLSHEVAEIPQRIKELMEKDSSGAETVIQHVLPHYLDFSGKFKKNIAFYASETTSFKSSSWANRLNLMDEIWVINDQMVECARNSGVTRPIKVVGHPTDINKFQKVWPPIPDIRNWDNGGNFIFYTIGEFNKRKNFGSLIKAFHREFDRFEPVSLLIKTSGPQQEVINFCNQVKAGLKLYQNENQYKQEIVITDNLSDENIYRLHKSCDVFVSSSLGEAHSIPAFDAMGFGNTPIVPNFGGFPMYIDNNVGWLVDGREEPCFGAFDTFKDLYTARDNWFQVDELHLGKCMREAYENKELRDEKSLNGQERVYGFTYEKVGARMKECLDV